MRIADPQRFKDVTAGIQNLAVILAIAVGAVWAILTMEAPRARAEYQRLLAEIRDHRVINVDIDARPASSAAGRYIVATVTLSNVGRTTELITWPDAPLNASLISLGDDNKPARQTFLGHRLDVHPLSESGLRLMPGVKMRRVFVVPVADAGLYLMDFFVNASHGEQTLAQQDGVGGVAWAEQALVTVP